MESRLTLIVLLFVDRSRRSAFEAFERRASALMGRHDGRIERRVALRSDANGSTPDEIHVVTFPDRASFERYRSDPEVRAMAALRAELIRETVVWEGLDLPPFGAAP